MQSGTLAFLSSTISANTSIKTPSILSMSTKYMNLVHVRLQILNYRATEIISCYRSVPSNIQNGTIVKMMRLVGLILFAAFDSAKTVTIRTSVASYVWQVTSNLLVNKCTEPQVQSNRHRFANCDIGKDPLLQVYGILRNLQDADETFWCDICKITFGNLANRRGIILLI